MPKIVFYLVSYYKRLKTNAQNCKIGGKMRKNALTLVLWGSIIYWSPCTFKQKISAFRFQAVPQNDPNQAEQKSI